MEEINSAEGQLYTLDYVVRSCLADIDEPDTSPLYMKLLKFANDGYRRLNLAGLMPINVKYAEIAVDEATNTAKLPSDYLYYLKIGLCVNGRILNLDLADDLCLVDDKQNPCPCSKEEAEEQAKQLSDSVSMPVGVVSWYYPFFQHYHNGQFTAGYYGFGAGFKRMGYQINESTGRIHLDGFLRGDKLLLEYVGNGMSYTGDAYVPATALPALQAFVHKQRTAFSRDKNENAKYMLYVNMFRMEQRAMNSRQNALTKAEWMRLFRKAVFQTPKR